MSEVFIQNEDTIAKIARSVRLVAAKIERMDVSLFYGWFYDEGGRDLGIFFQTNSVTPQQIEKVKQQICAALDELKSEAQAEYEAAA